MKKKKLKKILTPVILTVVLCILVAGFLVLKHFNSIETADGGETQWVTVFDKTGKTVTWVELCSGGSTISFTYENEVWVYDGDDKFPVDQDDMDEIAQTLMKMESCATVNPDDRADDSEYGLDSPNVAATAEYSDGTRFTFSFGSTNVFNDCQYFEFTGDSNIYMADTTVSTSLAKDLNSFYKPETFVLTSDGVTADSVTSIVLSTADGRENTVTDEDGVSDLLDLVKVMNLVKWEDYYADSEEMAESYGITEGSDKVTVNYTKTAATTDSDGNSINADVPASYTLIVGNKFDTADTDQSESGYFYAPEGSTVVYATDSETVESIFEFLTYEPAEETDTAE